LPVIFADSLAANAGPASAKLSAIAIGKTRIADLL
jgi:hypothetical protein